MLFSNHYLFVGESNIFPIPGKYDIFTTYVVIVGRINGVSNIERNDLFQKSDVFLMKNDVDIAEVSDVLKDTYGIIGDKNYAHTLEEVDIGINDVFTTFDVNVEETYFVTNMEILILMLGGNDIAIIELNDVLKDTYETVVEKNYIPTPE